MATILSLDLVKFKAVAWTGETRPYCGSTLFSCCKPDQRGHD